MGPEGGDTAEQFHGLVLRLRGRVGLTQRQLAAQLRVHVRTILGWEAGATYPSAASLQALIAAVLRAGGFTPGREADEAAALWAAAMRDAPRLRAHFDRAWFDELVTPVGGPVEGNASTVAVAPVSSRLTTGGARRHSWGEAPDVGRFVGRATERGLLRQWVSDERCRLVTVLGLGGIGKSLLASRAARDLAPSFERVFWRSLRDAPTPSEWLAEALGFLAPDDAPEAGDESARLRRLLELLAEAPCLLVLDNFETTLQPGDPAGDYRPGYGRYGALLRRLGETAHRSCLLITSREEPPELGPLRGERGPVRTLDLGGLAVEDGRTLLSDKRLDGDEAAWRALVERYGGNGLALQIVGETTRELFGGSIPDYLEYATATPAAIVGGVRDLLGAQIRRLSDPEHELLHWLAVDREPVGLTDLASQMAPTLGRGAILEAVERVRRRSLLERSERGRQVGLHSVVLEYVTERLIEEVAHELATGEPVRLLRQPLLKATAKDYVRRSQERLIAGPLLERLVATHGSARAAERRLMGLLDRWRGRPVEEQGYGPGNLVNLLRLLRGDLKGADLSGLAIRQAFLQDVEAQGASLAGAHLAEAVLAEAFSYPTSVALTPDGAHLAAGTSNGDVYCWRVANRRLLATMRGHTGAVWGVAFSGDGRFVASGGFDGTVRLWDANSGLPLATMRGHTGIVLSVALGGDGRLVASGGVDGTVRLWEASSGQPLATLEGHVGLVYSVALSGDGRLIITGGVDGTVRLWEADSGRVLDTLRGHTGRVVAVALSPDGRLVASGGIDGAVRLWDAERGLPLAVLPGHTDLVHGVALSGDGRLVASSGSDGTVRLWDVASGQPLAVLQGHSGGVRGVALSGDGRLVASGGVDGAVRLWEAEGGRSLATLQGHTGLVLGMALSGDGRLVASGGYDGTVRLWDVASGRPLAALQGHTGLVLGVALTRDGRLVASGGVDGTVRLWDTASGRSLAVFRGHTGAVWGVALSAGGQLVASGSFDGTARLWDASSVRPLATLEGHTGGVWGVAVDGDGRLVASGGVDGTVRLWDVASGAPLATLRGHVGEVYGMALSRDGRLVASGGVDGTVRLWDASNHQPLAILQGHDGGIWGVALSGDGRLVAGSGLDGTILAWEAAGVRPLTALQGQTGRVVGVAMSDDGQLVAGGDVDGTVTIWDASSGAIQRALRGERRYEGLDITGLTGITEAQRGTLFALGAQDRAPRPSS